MQVILIERVPSLGIIGDVVSVKDGFARNFLIPQKKALRATKGNIEYFESRKSHIEADNLAKKKEADAVASKMAGLAVEIIRQAGEFGHLFGSVRNVDIAKAISEAGFSVSKSQIILAIPIKTIGIYPIKVHLHPEVYVEILVNVAQSSDEANEQLEQNLSHKESN
jgi:large subunit ribosomal protein L9